MSDFRGLPACSCQITWLPIYERELRRRGIIGTQPPRYFQLIGGFIRSGGTHTGGGADDSEFISDAAIWVSRQMGADPTWHRPFNWDGDGGVEHVHRVLRGCPHLSSSARAQIVAVDNGGDGLLGDAPDNGPRPPSGRTWQEGIEWQRQQEALVVTDEDEQKIRAIVREVIAELPDAVWAHVVREANKAAGVTEQTAEAALKKAANR
jgi:hypothetical protein